MRCAFAQFNHLSFTPAIWPCFHTRQRRLLSRPSVLLSTALQYQPPRLDNIEDVENYCSGGFHPVSLGDVFYDGRYRVLHKLGFGGQSTVWLARDQQSQRLVSLKVLSAEGSRDCRELAIHQHLAKNETQHPGRPYIPSLLNHFSLTGPNGTHVCLVQPFAGPNIPSLSYTPGQRSGSRRLHSALAREFDKQVALAVDYLHSEGICHGDISASNVLLQLEGVNFWSDQIVYEQLGTAVVEELNLSTPLPTENTAVASPNYLVQPAKVGALDPKWFGGKVLLADLGQSFLSTSPPPEGLGTPFSYSSPDLLFERRASTQSDNWALGCTIFEIQAGTPLFASFFGGPDEVIRQWVQTLGRIPEPWWSAWERRYIYFDDSGKPRSSWSNNRPLAVEYPLHVQIEGIGEEGRDFEEAPGIHVVSSLFESPRVRLSQSDIATLEDLLSNLVKYVPEKRLSLARVLEHPWFSNES